MSVDPARATLTSALLTLGYVAARLAGAPPDRLWLFTFDPQRGIWVPGTAAVDVDTARATVSGNVAHFSIWAVFDIEAWAAGMLAIAACPPQRPITGPPVDLVVTLDSSGSMAWNDPNRLRARASQSLAGSLGTGDGGAERAGAVDFDWSARTLATLTTDLASVSAAVAGVDDNGETDIAAGVRRALGLIGTGSAERNESVVLLTDAWAAGTRRSSTGRAGRGVTIHTIGLGSEADAALLQSIATGTGGTDHAVATSQDLILSFAEVGEAMGRPLVVDADRDGLQDCEEIDGFVDPRFGELIRTSLRAMTTFTGPERLRRRSNSTTTMSAPSTFPCANDKRQRNVSRPALGGAG